MKRQPAKRRRKARRPRRPGSSRRGLLAITAFAAAAVILVAALLRPGRDEANADSTPAEIEEAARTACRLASAVKDTPRGSMAREGALLDIRARESEMRRAGFTTAADTFAHYAEITLIADGVISKD